MNPPVSDDELLARSRTEPEVLGELYRRHAGAIFRHLSRRVGTAVAENLLGEVFVVAVEARLRFRPHHSNSALPWLYGISANVIRSHRRRALLRSPRDDVDSVDWDAVDDRLDAGSRATDLKAALAALGPDDRELLLLVAWEGLTPAQAADALGITAVAARSRLHRARNRARAALDQPTATSAPTPAPNPWRI